MKDDKLDKLEEETRVAWAAWEVTLKEAHEKSTTPPTDLRTKYYETLKARDKERAEKEKK